MKKPPLTTEEKLAAVEGRYGKTLGDSKGQKPPEPAKVTLRPRMRGLKPKGVTLKVTKKF